MNTHTTRARWKLDEGGPTMIVDALDRAIFASEGPLAGNEYRELSVGDATGGRIGIRHLRALRPFETATGWHWHDMQIHVVYVLKGYLCFRFEGLDDTVRVGAGDCITQPAGVPHNVVEHSPDLELLEITLPQRFRTFEPVEANVPA